MRKYAIVGAGFSGAVIARELVTHLDCEVTVFDSRSHVAGNCHTERDPSTGIMIHTYGPHIFHTSDETVWSYVNRFAKFNSFTNRVKARTPDNRMFSLPINLLTINQFFNRCMNPSEARQFLSTLGDSSIGEPENFEQQALKFLGRELYEAFFKGYTLKQWGVDPTQLPASILKRLPVRFNYDDNYFADKYQGIPVDGYTSLVEKILDVKGVTTCLNTSFYPGMASEFDHVFWSGPLDAWFDFKLGRLGYRSLRFQRFDAEGDFQGNAVINYGSQDVPWTRISEHKHFAPDEEHARTVCFREYSFQCGTQDIPYYPIRLSNDKSLLTQYIDLARRQSGVTFCGRLGTYRYLDMHLIVGEALTTAASFINDAKSKNTAKSFYADCGV